MSRHLTITTFAPTTPSRSRDSEKISSFRRYWVLAVFILAAAGTGVATVSICLPG